MGATRVFKHKRVAIDFDGTLFEDCSDVEQSNRERTPLSPQPGAAEATHWLREQGFELLIFTCRPDYHRNYMQALLERHGIVHDYILFYTKPRVDLYVDDKGYRFTSWETTRDWISARLSAEGSLVEGSPQPFGVYESCLRNDKRAALALPGGSTLLDVGCGDGDVFADGASGLTLDGVEPDPRLREAAVARGVYRAVHDSTSQVDPGAYDGVLLLGVLEHVDDEAGLLATLAAARRIYVTVPNAASFHRQVGVQLGLLSALDELGPQDRAVGHRRYHDMASLRATMQAFCEAHGFVIERIGSCAFKFTSNAEMAGFADRHAALGEAARLVGLTGDDRPHGAELYCVVGRPS